MSKDYTLTGRPIRERDQFIVTIIGDYNDGDYVFSTETYSPFFFDEIAKDLEKLQPRILVEGADFSDLENLTLPLSPSYDFCHTITKVKVEYIDKDSVIWDVTF